jgi:hypothetical protein
VPSMEEFVLARLAEDAAALEGCLQGRPAREVEAKRRILVAARLSGATWPLPVLAAIYADHPDYRAEWRP